MNKKSLNSSNGGKNPKPSTDYSNRSGSQTPTYRRPVPPPPPKKK